MPVHPHQTLKGRIFQRPDQDFTSCRVSVPFVSLKTVWDVFKSPKDP
jgi:hypothetical protein